MIFLNINNLKKKKKKKQLNYFEFLINTINN